MHRYLQLGPSSKYKSECNHVYNVMWHTHVLFYLTSKTIREWSKPSLVARFNWLRGSVGSIAPLGKPAFDLELASHSLHPTSGIRSQLLVSLMTLENI